MSELFDQQVKATLKQDFEYDEQKDATQIKEVVTMYKKQNKRAKILLWRHLAFFTVVMLFCFGWFFITNDIKMMLLMVILILMVNCGIVLMKLWWWVYGLHNNTSVTLKAIQLQLSEIQESAPAKKDK